MASWKEKGEVPDSEEEEDDDSQESPDEGYIQNLFLAPGEAQRKQDRCESGHNAAGKELWQDYLSAEALSQDREFQSQQVSPSPRAFKQLRPSLASDQIPALRESSFSLIVHADDEMSHSNARFSSSLSTLGTPPIQSQELDGLPPMHDPETDSPNRGHYLPVQYQPADWEMGQDIQTLECFDELPLTRRRSLRQRNPIQLHPYALEGEKYRRTLMARGMRPLRLAPVQESGRELARDQHSLYNAFEEGDDHILSLEDETQLPQPSQPSTNVELPDTSLACPASTELGSEDEFPDIDQLLDRSNERFIQAGPKRRKKTYGSQHIFKRPSVPSLLNEVQLQNVGVMETRRSIPPSPPMTSSPIPMSHAQIFDQRETIPTPSLPSSRAGSLERASPERGGINGSLPTPDTSSINHTIDLIAEVESEENPFISESDSSAISQRSEVDQSIQVRRVGKQFRGVLPASWLRLDQRTHRNKNTKITSGGYKSVSPTKVAVLRRGVAIPKDAIHRKSPVKRRIHSESHLVLSDSESDEPNFNPTVSESSAAAVFSDSIYSQTDRGSVIEDNRVDPMLPSGKRQTKLLPGASHRRNRMVNTSLFAQKHAGVSFQPKITDHLQKTRISKTVNLRKKQQRVSNAARIKPIASIASQKIRSSSIPALSILDAIKRYSDSQEQMPAFIRIAARNAKSKRGLGRHSPTRKFIRLSNRTDTQDAQSVLRDWREGTLQPCTDYPDPGKPNLVRKALSNISPNVQRSAVSVISDGNDVDVERSSVAATARRILISRSWAGPKSNRSPKSSLLVSGKRGLADDTKIRISCARPTKVKPSDARPAQLETSVKEYSTRDYSVYFGSTKKVLDTLYRRGHKRDKPRSDVQLARFFGKEYKTIKSDLSVNSNESRGDTETMTRTTGQIKSARRRKPVPRRLDANAAVFRQPSEPQILEFLTLDSEMQNSSEQPGKLLGLGGFGTNYTVHFDVFPLQPGVFFHKSTFIGSGQLFKVLKVSEERNFDCDRGHYEFQLAGKQVRWGSWDENVSSEFGMCFDWIIEQLEDHETKFSDINVDGLTECIGHIINYVNTCLSFSDLAFRNECLSRAIKVLSCFVEQMEILTRPSGSIIDRHRVFVDLFCLTLIVTFQFLHITRSNTLETDLGGELETILQRAALHTVGLLLCLGLAPIRRLCDDLQYSAYRETGIGCDRYSTQAWVIVMHTLHAARIPRVSFWDLVNSQLMKRDEEKFRDARILEGIWYDMFSLLPLMDFNTNGVLIPGDSWSRSCENWALPQMIARKIFALYNSKSRQSPSFNLYCRALFSRCVHLVETWCWRRHGVIVGTLFDFFAMRNLAHLRNEEVYRSPRFLEMLDKAPSMVILAEDRCFHILLKLIATSIKQMRDRGDNKGIRHLITRVLPNHDRQYPREKAVRQRDLACLRNHHDLLCTLFWAAPPELRPPVSLIRELVNPENSHLRAYLINLRAWRNLTRFVLASAPTSTIYLPLAKWHNEYFLKLLAQVHSAEKDIQDQLQNLSVAAQHLISQHTIATTVRENRHQIIIALAEALDYYKSCMSEAPDMDSLKVIFCNQWCLSSLTNALGLFRHHWQVDMPVIETALDIVCYYTTRLVGFARALGVQKQPSSEDSQEYGSDVFIDVQVDVLEYTGELSGQLMINVRDILRASLTSRNTIMQGFTDKVVETWTVMAACFIIAKTYDLSDFFAQSGPLNELNLEGRSSYIRHYAPHFLGKLAAIIGDHFDLGSTHRDHLSDWLCIVIRPGVSFRFEHELLPHFAKCEPIIDRALAALLSRSTVRRKFLSTVKGFQCYRSHLIHEILQFMHLELQNDTSQKERYEEIVRMMLNLLKLDMDATDPQSFGFSEHQEFVTFIYSSITTFFGDRHTINVDQFSDTNSANNSHRLQITSRKILATIRNYGLRLSTARGKNELNHYVLVVLKFAAMAGTLGDASDIIQEAMCDDQGLWIDISHHFLAILSPSFIYAAFVSEVGFVPAEALIKAAQEHLMDIVDCDNSQALEGVSKIAASIVHGVHFIMEQHSLEESRLPTHSELIYMLLLSTRFMVVAFDWLPIVMEICDEYSQTINESLTSFYHFACGVKEYVKSPLKIFVNTLSPCYPTVWDDKRDSYLRDYEDMMNGNYSMDEQEHALMMLACEVSWRNQDEFAMQMDAIRELHHFKYSSIYYVFHDMRGSEFFKKSKDISKGDVERCVLDFSSVILEDYRRDWSRPLGGGDIKIKAGKDESIAQGLEARKIFNDKLSLDLQKALIEYVACYEKIYGMRSASQLAKVSRKEVDITMQGLIY